MAGAHNPERATPILGLCHGVFTDQFIFRHILGHFFPPKQNFHHVYERIRSIRYQKGKLNAIKRQKISFLGLQVCGIQKIFKFAPKRSKNKEPPKLKLFLELFGVNFEYLLNSTNLQTFDILYYECAHRHGGNSIFAGKGVLKCV